MSAQEAEGRVIAAHKTCGICHVPLRRTPMSLQMKITSSVLALLLFGAGVSLYAVFMPPDPGGRCNPPAPGRPIDRLRRSKGLFFGGALQAFQEVQSVEGH